MCVRPCMPVCAFISPSISPTQLVSSSARTLRATGQMSNLCASLSMNATVRISHIWVACICNTFQKSIPNMWVFSPLHCLDQVFFKAYRLKSACEEEGVCVTLKPHLQLPRSVKKLCASESTIVGMDRAAVWITHRGKKISAWVHLHDQRSKGEKC